MKFNMHGLLPLAAAFLLALPMMPASAAEQEDENGYFGMSITKDTFELADAADVDINTLDVRLGRMWTERFGVEGRLGLGFNENNVSGCHYVSGELVCENTKVKIDQYFGVYGKGYFTGPGRFRPYGLVGYTSAKATIALDSISTEASSETFSDLSYGVGFEAGRGQMRFSMEYVSLFDKDGDAVAGFNLGFIVPL